MTTSGNTSFRRDTRGKKREEGTSLRSRFSLLASRFRPAVVALVVATLLALAAAVLLPSPSHDIPTILGSDSERVARAIREEFDTPFARASLLLIEHIPHEAASDSGRATVRRLLEPISAMPGVLATHSPASSLDTLLLGKDGRSAIALVGHDERDMPVMAMHAAIAEVVDSLHRVDPRFNVGITGVLPIAADLATYTRRALIRAELVAAPVTIAAAWFAYGSITAVLGGLLTAGATAAITLMLVRLLGLIVPLGGLAEPVAVLVSTALALDYFLWRRRGGFGSRDLRVAAAVAITGFAALLLAPTPEIRGAAIGGMVAAAIASLIATVWKPALRRRRRDTDGWLHLVPVVLARPVPLLVATLLPLTLLAWRGVTARIASDSTAWLPEQGFAVRALRRLDERGRGSAAVPSIVMVELTPSTSLNTPAGWQRVSDVVRRIREVPQVGHVAAVTTVGTGEQQVTLDVVPPHVLGALVSRDRTKALVHVVAAGEQTVQEGQQLADRLRVWLADDPMLTVGGYAAMAIDHHDALKSALVPLALLASLGTALALMVVFRAPVLALKTVLLNLLVAFAAVGLVSLFAPMGGLPVTIPLAAFGTAFALSIDYELLLLFGVQRAGRHGPDAIARGLASAAPLMIRGGVLLIGVLGGFLLSGFAPLVLLGAVLASAIAIDVIVVRPLVAPALLMVMGKWNWWPR
jgi:RND superfamily putative drug exporter